MAVSKADRRLSRELMGEAGSKIVDYLEGLLDEQVSAKQNIEEDWLASLRQYNGQYSSSDMARIKEKGGCQLFANITRPKTGAWIARLIDVLFPADDKNWGIAPTPIPDLLGEVPQEEQMPQGMPSQGMPQPGMPPQGMSPQPGMPPQQEGAPPPQPPGPPPPKPLTPIEQAKKRAAAMEKLIEDQLVESGFNHVCRNAIRDACKYGTGIIKGPVSSTKLPRKWGKAIDGPTPGAFVLAPIRGEYPSFVCVSPWDFFPDMAAATPQDAEFFFERHMMTKRDLRRLAKTPGFSAEMIRKVMATKPSSYQNDKLSDRLEIDGIDTNTSLNRKFTVWEFRGSLEPKEVAEISALLGKDRLREYVENENLDAIDAIVWFTEGVIINIGINPLDGDEPAYSVFNFMANETNMFGYGVPYLLADTQAARNAAWRMMIDNAALSTGPQVVINQDAISPEDGDWTLRERKVWRSTNPMTPVNAAFATFSIDSHQNELLNIIQTTAQFADDEINLPELAQGGSGTHQTVTAQGMGILQNNAAIPLRNLVKEFDDKVTIPVIRRCFNWNMQFAEDESVKGDAEIYAKGSTVLLVRDMQAQSLMGFAGLTAANPNFVPLVKHAELLRKIAQAHQISADEVIKTDEMIAEEQARAQPQPAPEEIKAQAQAKIAETAAQAKIQAAQIAEQGRVQAAQLGAEVLAQKVQATVEIADADRQAKLQIAQIQNDGALQKTHAEVGKVNATIAQKDKELSVKTALAVRPGQRPGGMFPG